MRLIAQRGVIAAVAAVVVLPAAAVGCGGSAGVHNAGIVWGCRPFSNGSCPGARENVYVIEGANVDGSGRHVVATDFGDSEGDPAWSRDGHALAFYVRNSDGFNIEVVWPKKRTHRAIYDDWRSPSAPRRTFGVILNPSWAHDGAHIAVSDGWNDLGTAGTIRIVSIATRRWSSVTKPNAHALDNEPAWSPDGRSLAFARQYYFGANQGPPTIYLARPNGRGLRRLTPGRSPSWSPDGRYIAFAWAGGIYRIGADGRGRTRIVGGVDASQVSWSPDGRKLLYTTEVGGKAEGHRCMDHESRRDRTSARPAQGNHQRIPPSRLAARITKLKSWSLRDAKPDSVVSGRYWARTSDLLLVRQALSQLS